MAPNPLSPGSLLYVLYVLYLTRQPTEHPLSPGSLLYVLDVLYLTRQPPEHPLSPNSLLYVLYVLSRDGKVTSRGTLCTEPSSCNTNHVERCIRTTPL